MKRKPIKQMTPDQREKLAVSYIRVSTKDQQDEGFSLPAQQELIRQYAAKLGITIVEEFVDVETAKAKGRADFGRMVQSLDEHPDIPIILTEKTDRLHRNWSDYVTIQDLERELHFIKEGSVISKDSPSSHKLMYDVKTLMAKNYIDNLSEEVRKGLRQKASEGIYPSFAPIGYENVILPAGKRGIAPDPERAELVRRAFELYATGNYSLKKLARWAKSEGLSFRGSGRPINKSTINTILHNRIYTGDFDWDGARYKGIHTPLVSQELWEKVQDVLAAHCAYRHRVVKHDLPFAGLIRCGCGCAIVGEIKKGRYIYYRCTRNKGQCRAKYIKQETLEVAYAAVVARIALPVEFADWAVSVIREETKEEQRFHLEAATRMEKDLTRIEKKLDEMYDDKAEGLISAETYRRKAGPLNQEQARLQRCIQEHRSGAPTSYANTSAQVLELAGNAAKLFEMQPAGGKRKLLKIVVSNSIWRDGKLSVEYRQPFDLFATWSETLKSQPETETIKKGQNENWLLR